MKNSGAQGQLVTPDVLLDSILTDLCSFQLKLAFLSTQSTDSQSNGVLGFWGFGVGWCWLVLVRVGWCWLVLVGVGWCLLVLVGVG